MSEFDAPIYVAGHRGMVGSALVRALEKRGHRRLILRTSAELDLRDQQAVHRFLAEVKPSHVYMAAAKVGGIHANNAYKADFLYDNLLMQANVIEGSRIAGVDKLLFLGSSCIYPKHASQPMNEDALLTGALEPTNEPYAIAKIAGLKMCDAYRDQHGCNFISAMPTNLYGPGDNYHPENSHVLPAMIRRFHEAKMSGQEEVVCWGSGTPRREFCTWTTLQRRAAIDGRAQRSRLGERGCRRGRHHPGARRDSGCDGGLRRLHRLGPIQTRRHA